MILDEAEVEEAMAVSDRGWWTASVAAAAGVAVLVATTVADQTRNFAMVGLLLIAILFVATWFGAWLPSAVRIVGAIGAAFVAFASLVGLAYLVPIPGLVGLALAWTSSVPTEAPPVKPLVLAALASAAGVGVVLTAPPDNDPLLFQGDGLRDRGVEFVIELPGATSYTVTPTGICIGLDVRATDDQIEAIVDRVASLGGELVDDASC